MSVLKLGIVTCVLAAGTSFAVLHTSGKALNSDLVVEYSKHGIEKLSYEGVVLEDLSRNPEDAFHIWHMKMIRLDGKPLTAGAYGWGENNDGRTWDGSTHTWTYRFPWGSIVTGFVQNGARLDITVTAHNNAGSGVILDGATIYPIVLHLPQPPRGFATHGSVALAFNSDGPSVTAADYGTGEVVAVVPDATRPLCTGFLPASQPNSYTPVLSGTALDAMAAFQPHLDRPVAPGETDTFTVSLRFAPSGTDPVSLAADAYANWTKAWPMQLHWPDRRMIGTIYLASPPTGDASRPGGYANNPRRYFNNGNASDFDLRTQAGLARFQRRILQEAAESVNNLRRLHAQGAITWDLEGEKYPQETSYVCSPDQIARVAPEMESTIGDRASPYAGMKLDDAWFKIFRDAGYRVGVCVRPQHFRIEADGTATQVFLPNGEVTAELIHKMKYAHDRWGATLFYLDSTVEKNGAPLDASILQTAAAAMPDSLLIPEEATIKDYAYTAPFRSFLFHGDLGTAESVYRVYPDAFSVNLVNDVDPEKLVSARQKLTLAVRGGDILMTHADYWQANNPLLLEIYKDAERR